MVEDNKLIITEDGSHSLYNPTLNVTYHSFHGAIQESQHVFIQSGLEYQYQQGFKDLNVFEVGFGTGLNVLLSAIWAEEKNIRIVLDSIEPHPVSNDLIQKLNYPELLGKSISKNYLQKAHAATWRTQSALNEWLTLSKINSRIEDYNIVENRYDIIFFDAFAPSKQPEMWQLDRLTPVIKSLRPKGIFVTYCAQGQLKRNLKKLGLEVETLPGPPGKKEMVRGVLR